MVPPSTVLAIANQHRLAGRLADAEQACRQLLHAATADATSAIEQSRALTLLGLILEEQGQLEAAVSAYQQAIALHPTAHEAFNNQGNALQKQGKRADAIALYQRAIALKPNYADAYSNLGVAFLEAGRQSEAVDCLCQAQRFNPQRANIAYNLGSAYRSMGKLEQAIAAFEQAIALQADYAEAHNYLALVLREQGRIAEAIPFYENAIALRPDYADAHLNLGIAWLLLGDFQRGWPEYEWRWQLQGAHLSKPRAFAPPEWDGTDLAGKTILLHAEQGIGDTLQFVRYAALVAQRGGRVVVECQAPLQRLLSTLTHVQAVISQGDPLPAFDVHAPFLSLPRLFATDLSTIPDQVPYLHPSPAIEPLPTLPNTLFKVGIVWSGNALYRGNRRRSCPVEAFLPLVELPGVALFSLQKGKQTADLAGLPGNPIYDLSDRLHDFADTATVIAQLDLVISVDTAVAHLAGALGKPVWILLATAADWRWLCDRTDSPWYPTATLFRQSQPGDWQEVLERVKTALMQWQSPSVQAHTPSSIPSSPPSAPTLKVDSPAVSTGMTPSPLSSSPLSSSPDLRAVVTAPRHIIGIGWELGATTGWGVYGLNLTLQLLRLPQFTPLPLLPLAQPQGLNPLHRHLLQSAFKRQHQFQQILDQHPQQVIQSDFLTLKALGNQCGTDPRTERIQGDRNVGVIFSEDTTWSPKGLAIARQFDRIMAGSTWNAEILKSRGLNQVEVALQGIDPTLFHPAPRANLFPHRFVIFSGGKLEYRKGQDIVIAAFKAFHSRHPDALLLTAWHNPWVKTLIGLEQGGHVTSLPRVTATGQLQVVEWLTQQGIGADAVVDVGAISHYLASSIVREADVALFPNRAEGGTNLVAMESLACGVPTILSANTGHLDLLGDEHCYPLRSQALAQPIPLFRGTEGWGESHVDEIVETLEGIYNNREDALKRGQSGAQFMQAWTWDRQIQRLLAQLRDLL